MPAVRVRPEKTQLKRKLEPGTLETSFEVWSSQPPCYNAVPMKYLTRKNAIAFLVVFQAFLVVLALVFGVPAHLLKPTGIAVAIIAVAVVLVNPAAK
jgi:hypothetical protein